MAVQLAKEVKDMHPSSEHGSSSGGGGEQPDRWICAMGRRGNERAQGAAEWRRKRRKESWSRGRKRKKI